MIVNFARVLALGAMCFAAAVLTCRYGGEVGELIFDSDAAAMLSAAALIIGPAILLWGELSYTEDRARIVRRLLAR